MNNEEQKGVEDQKANQVEEAFGGAQREDTTRIFFNDL